MCLYCDLSVRHIVINQVAPVQGAGGSNISKMGHLRWSSECGCVLTPLFACCLNICPSFLIICRSRLHLHMKTSL